MTTSFDDEKPIEREVEILSDSILGGLAALQKRISSLFPKEFTKYPQRLNDTIVYPEGESESTFVIRRNLQTALASNVQTLIRSFQQSQRNFLQRLIHNHYSFYNLFFLLLLLLLRLVVLLQKCVEVLD